MLKLKDKIVTTSNMSGNLEVSLNQYRVTIYYDDTNQKNDELDNLTKEKEFNTYKIYDKRGI